MLPILEINNRCISCNNCEQICPEYAIIVKQNTYYIDTWKCTLCQICIEVCPVDSIKVINTKPDEK